MNKKKVTIIVAHPDDETLWAGGTILSHPHWDCFVVCLTRKSDENRAPRFYNALKVLKATGIMGDLNDGAEQLPLKAEEIEQTILNLLPDRHFDLIITHNPEGEYTRHIRHEETGSAVIKLWRAGKIMTSELWIFAYEDSNREYFPRPFENASIYNKLTKRVWARKYSIMTEIYGFAKRSWEAKTTPKAEAFCQFINSSEAMILPWGRSRNSFK